MAKLISLVKIVFEIFITYFIVQIIIGLPLILILKIDFLGKDVTKGLILINILTELIVIWFYIYKYNYYDRLLNSFKNHNFIRVIYGTLLSIFVPLFLYYILYKFNNGKFVRSSTNAFYQIGIIFSMFILAAFEELLCRFIILEKYSTLKSKNISIIISSLFFALLHFANPGITLLAFLNLFLFGIILSLVYFKTRDILLLSFIHFGWNYTTGCFIGSNVSGMKFQSFYSYIGGSSNLLDGGKFGIEGSPITLFGLILIITIYSICTSKLEDKIELVNV